MSQGLIIDSFAGGGGASTGIEWALGRSPDFAVNHDDDALLMHAANHPDTVHLKENIWKVEPRALTQGKPVFLLWASPDCRHHSKAKGGAPVSRSVRGLADVVLVWAETVSPQIILLENVEEFAQWGPLAEDGKPCPARKGAEFARWVRHLEKLGYAVDWRELRACDHGAPTIRKRLFVVARRDRKPILWPAPTHAKPDDPRVKAGVLKPWRTAAEIIDWSLPCPSMFLTRPEAKAAKLQVVRPLADKTMARIARGFKRHVLDRAEPFVVTLNHASEGFRGQALGEPFRTVTSARDAHGLVTPFVSHAQQGGRSRPADAPLHTVCASAKDQNQILAPFLAQQNGGWDQRGGRSIDEPLATITTAGGQVTPITGFLVPRYGERPGQEPRSRSVEEPAPVVVPTGNGGDLAACYLAQQNTDMIGHDAETPLSTIVGKGCTQTPVMGFLASLQNNTARGACDEPVGTVLAAGNHHTLISPFVTSYYSEGGQDSAADAPMPTVPTRARFSPITPEIVLPPLTPAMAERARQVASFLRAHGAWDGPGEFVTLGDFIVWDIGMRMLTPRELARAQGFPESYDITAGGRLTETAQRHKIGNSVCPPLAEAVARANCINALALPDVRRRKAKVASWAGLPPRTVQDAFTVMFA
ncbi:DNA (cytosine-5)-methyltransferase 1 [Bosea sp. OAE506]|uniref:DNA cytosine methyltransferase n=1 Tax=Bosea sp. OAE506 TaxID=2663870 RepID=UPI001788F899